MKTKKILTAIIAIALAVFHCFLVVSCTGNTDNVTTESDFIATTSSKQDETTTSSKSTEEVTTKNDDVIHTGDYIDPLTGYACEKDLSNRKPIAVVVDNSNLAWKNQAGINEASIVYEGLVAPGITRFLALYSDYETIPYVCNVRSTRKFMVDWAQSHNSVLVCHGGPSAENAPYNIYNLLRERYGSNGADLIINTQTEYWFATAEGGDLFNTIRHRGERKDLQYDTCITKEALIKAVTSASSKFVKAGGTVNGKVLESIKHLAKDEIRNTEGLDNGTYVSLKFTAQGTQTSTLVEYRYDENSKTYLRFQEGNEHIDSETKKQLSFKNLIVIVTDVKIIDSGVSSDPYMTDIKTTGQGTVYYFCDGKVQKGYWSKSSVSSEMSLVDLKGNEIKLEAGNTYIGYVDTSFEGKTGFYD